MKILKHSLVGICSATVFILIAAGALLVTTVAIRGITIDARDGTDDATSRIAYDDLAAGPFVSNGDATVTDQNTGIVWMEQDIADGKMLREEAMAACESSTVGGFDDWRLASVPELQSVVDYAKVSPASGLPNLRSIYYWTSTEYVPSPQDTGWAFLGYTGGVFGNSLTHVGLGRCVRAHDVDLSAGRGDRSWMTTDATADAVTWQEASDACVAQTAEGHDDWRMPSAKELVSIVDYDRSESDGIAGTLAGLAPEDYWTADSLGGYDTYALYIGMDGGNVSPGEKTEAKRVRCVR
jgi:hypothetical protein